MRYPTVSLIIPAYQAARTIGRTLDSVFAQSRPPDEVLVVNDGSTDKLVSALLPYEKRVTLLSKPNGGTASARNHGIDHATGALIAFLDADDTWEPGKLEYQLKILSQHPEIGLVAGRYYEQRPGHPRAAVQSLDPHRMGRVLSPSGAEVMEVATRIWTSTVLVRRQALADHRFVSGREPAEDRDLWYRVIAQDFVYLSPELLATQILEPGSLSRSNLDVDCRNMLRVVRRHGKSMGSRGLRTWEAHCYRRWAGNHLAQGRPRQSLAPACSWHRLQPLSAEAWWIIMKALKGAALPQLTERSVLKGATR